MKLIQKYNYRSTCIAIIIMIIYVYRSNQLRKSLLHIRQECIHVWVYGKERNGKRKRKTEISQLCKVNDHYHSVFFDMNMNMES